MVALLLLPVVASLLVLAAHFLRSGNIALVVLVLVFMALLAVRRRWAARLVQVALLLGAVEWVRTAGIVVGRCCTSRVRTAPNPRSCSHSRIRAVAA